MDGGNQFPQKKQPPKNPQSATCQILMDQWKLCQHDITMVVAN
jgi:hypothetical protein